MATSSAPCSDETQAVVITVKFFASSREAVGLNSTEISLPADASSLSKLRQQLQHQFPALDLSDLSFAVNKKYVSRSYLEGRLLSHGDEVALIPPISGG